MRSPRAKAFQALKEIDEARQALQALSLLAEPADNRDEPSQNFGCLAKAIAAKIDEPWIVLHDYFHDHGSQAEDEEAVEDGTT